MNLSRNFSLQELIKSDTAIRKGIDNNPNVSYKCIRAEAETEIYMGEKSIKKIHLK